MIEVFSYSLFSIRSLFGDFRLTENEKISFISTTSTEVKKGTLFIPLRGNRDGHEFIPDALSRGAVAFLCEKDHPILKELNFEEIQKAIIVDNTLYALGKIAAFHRNRFNPLVIGITGSSGKTTTKELMGLVALQIGKNQVVITEKNYNNSREIARLTAIARPGIALVTNVGPCHIENLGSVEGIARAKAEIIEGMPERSILFIPETVLHRKVFQEKAKQQKVILKNFSAKKSHDIKIEQVLPEGFELNLLGSKLNWNTPGEKILENLSGVIAVAKELNFNPDEIRKGLFTYKAKDKRFVIEKKQYRLINDTYNANPDSMESSLTSLRQVASTNPYYAILGDMKELGKFSKLYHLQLGLFCKDLGLSGLITFGKDAEWIAKEYYKNRKREKILHFIDSNK